MEGFIGVGGAGRCVICVAIIQSHKCLDRLAFVLAKVFLDIMVSMRPPLYHRIDAVRTDCATKMNVDVLGDGECNWQTHITIWAVHAMMLHARRMLRRHGLANP